MLSSETSSTYLALYPKENFELFDNEKILVEKFI